MKCKRIIIIAIIMTMLFSICACKKTPASPTDIPKATPCPRISMYDLQKSMLDADSTLPEMMSVNGSAENAESQFAYVSDMDYTRVDDFFIAYAKDGNKRADEIVVISVNDDADTAAAVESLKNHVHDRENLYSQYGPEQVERVQNAVVFSDGQYAVLIICDNYTAVRAAFSEFIANQS